MTTSALLAIALLLAGPPPAEHTLSPRDDPPAADLPPGPFTAGITPWPFTPQDTAHPVANHYCAPLRPTAERSYIHGGIDIRKPAGTSVLAVADGWIRIYREGAMDNAVLVEADGNRWEYRHLAADSTPKDVRDAARLGLRIDAGTVIGTVAPWGLGYAHLHLNRRRADGTITDPLAELVPAVDDTPPTVDAIAFLPPDGDAPIAGPETDAPWTLRGTLRLVVSAHDPGDDGAWIHPPRRVTAVLRSTTVRDQPPAIPLCDGHPFNGALPGQVGFPIPRYPRGRALDPYLRSGPLATQNPIPRPGPQRFSIVATDRETDTGAQVDTWDSRTVPDGMYTLEVTVADRAGNATTVERFVTIENREDSTPAPPTPVDPARATVAFATAFEGDRVRHTFAVPPSWHHLPLHHLEHVTVVEDARNEDGGTVTIEVDTTGVRRSITTEVRAGTRLDDGRKLIIAVHPLFEDHPSSPRLVRGAFSDFELRIALRTEVGHVTFHTARWSHDGAGEELRVTRHGLNILTPLTSTLTVPIPAEALGGTLHLEIEVDGRRRSIERAIPHEVTTEAL